MNHDGSDVFEGVKNTKPPICPRCAALSNWFLASQLVAELKRCTVVDLDAELGKPAGKKR